MIIEIDSKSYSKTMQESPLIDPTRRQNNDMRSRTSARSDNRYEKEHTKRKVAGHRVSKKIHNETSRNLNVRTVAIEEEISVKNGIEAHFARMMSNLNSDDVRDKYFEESAEGEMTIDMMKILSVIYDPDSTLVASSVTNDLNQELHIGASSVQRKGNYGLEPESGRSGVVIQMTNLVLSYEIAGILKAQAMNIIYYLIVAMIHSAAFLIVPAISDFLLNVKWNDSMTIVYFFITLIIAESYANAGSDYDKYPRRVNDMLCAMDTMASETSTFLVNILCTKISPSCNQRDSVLAKRVVRMNCGDDEGLVVDEALHDMYVQGIGTLLDILSISMVIIPMHRAAADSHIIDNSIMLYYKEKLNHLVRKLDRLNCEGFLNPVQYSILREKITILHKFTDDIEFEDRYSQPPVLKNSINLRIKLFVYIILPLQVYSQMGFWMIAMYPCIAFIIEVVNIIRDLMGSPFDIYHHSVQTNNFELWTHTNSINILQQILRFENYISITALSSNRKHTPRDEE